MDTGDMVMLAAVAIGGYLIYQHVQQQAATSGPTGATTGSVMHQCPTGYDWIANPLLANGGTCLPKGNI